MDKQILNKLKRIDLEIRKEKGVPTFFAAFLRTDILQAQDLEKWDLLFSAAWVNEKNRRKEREYIFTKLIKKFKPDELSSFLQKLDVIDRKDPFIKGVVQNLGVIDDKDKKAMLFEELSVGKGKNLIVIKSAYIFSSTPPMSAETKPGRTGFPVSQGVDMGENPDAFGKIQESKAEN